MQDFWGNTPLHLLLTCTAAAFPKAPPPASVPRRLTEAILCLLRAGAVTAGVNCKRESIAKAGNDIAQAALADAAAVLAGTAQLECSVENSEEMVGGDEGAEGDGMAEFAMPDPADVPAAAAGTGSDAIVQQLSGAEGPVAGDAAGDGVLPSTGSQLVRPQNSSAADAIQQQQLTTGGSSVPAMDSNVPPQLPRQTGSNSETPEDTVLEAAAQQGEAVADALLDTTASTPAVPVDDSAGAQDADLVLSVAPDGAIEVLPSQSMQDAPPAEADSTSC